MSLFLKGVILEKLFQSLTMKKNCFYKVLSIKQHIYQRRLSRIGTPEKSKFGHIRLRKLCCFNSSFEKGSRYDFYHTKIYSPNSCAYAASSGGIV